MQDNRKGAGVYDRRVELLQPTTGQDPDNFNEVKTTLTVYLSNVPAAKRGNSGDKEALEDRVETSLTTVEWEMRYPWGVNIRANWIIRDLHDNQRYLVVAPVIEIGRRIGVKIKTELIQ